MVASAFAGYGQGYSNYRSNSFGVGYLSSVGPIQAAVQSRRFLSIVDAPSTYSDATPLNIDVPPSTSPINFLLRSKSSPLNVQSLHEGSAGSYASSSSVDAPHVRRHDVYRPVIQQLNEIVQPSRLTKQYVRTFIANYFVIFADNIFVFCFLGTPN